MSCPVRARVLSILVLTGPVLAEEPGGAEDPIDLGEEVVVRAARPVTTVGGASAVEATVDSLDLPAAPTVEEVLRDLPMLHIRTNSRGQAEISARGSESRQVAVLVDGIPLTLAWDARADVSVIPATAIDDVTFTRGLSSMLHGPNVLGGVVEMRVGQSMTPRDRSLTVAVGTDHVGSIRTRAAAAVPVLTDGGELLVRGGIGFRDSPGDPLADGIEEPVETDDDLRLNTDLQNVDGFMSLRYRADHGAWVALSGSAFREERGIAAELGLPDDEARLWRYPSVSRTLGVLSAGTGRRPSPLGGSGSVEASLGVDRGRTEIEAYTTRAYDEVAAVEEGDDLTLTGRLSADQTLGDRGVLRSSVTLAQVDHEETTGDGAADYRQRLFSVGAETTWRLLDSRGRVESLSMSLGAAYDRAETPRTGGRDPQDPLSEVGGRLGFSAVMRGGTTVLHAGVSRRGRFPALRELYSGALNRFVPNPDLEPEKLLTTEAGVTVRRGRGRVQVVGFRTLLEDAVVRVTLDDGRLQRVNRDELETTGVEVLGAVAIGPVDVVANATLQWADLTDTEAGQTDRPENLPDALGDFRVLFPVGAGVRGSASLAYTGDQYSIDQRTGDDAELDAEAVIGAALWRGWPVRLPWGAGTFTDLETRITLENAADAALYDAWGLPGPGRRVRFEVRLR